MLRPCHFDQSADRVVIAPPETQSNPRHRLQASRPCGLISELEQENDQPKSGRRWWISPIPFASELAVGVGCLRNLNRWNSRQYSIIEKPCSHKKRLHRLTPMQPSDTFSAMDFSGALLCRAAEPDIPVAYVWSCTLRGRGSRHEGRPIPSFVVITRNCMALLGYRQLIRITIIQTT
jgi:hypothetical protein